MEKKRVVITGMGVVSCFGTDVETFNQNLLAGNSGVRLITQEDFDTTELENMFGAPVVGFNPEEFLDKKQARRVDPCISFAIGAGKKALAMSGVNLEALNKRRAGVIIGSGMGGMQVFSAGVEAVVQKKYRRISPFFVPFIITNMPGALLAIELGFEGPNFSVSTACATSNYAVSSAAELIQNGKADLILAGGVEATTNPTCYAGFAAMRTLSRNNEECKKASKPWDKKRDGFVMGDGAGVFVLESLEHALKRGATIYAEYKGSSKTCDAHHITEPKADGEGVAWCIEQALADAGLTPDDINYVNAHATSTQVGDLCEIRALKRVFGPHLKNMRVNATKSLIGHALGASGALELVATVMAINRGKVHPTINILEPEEELEGIDIVKDRAQEFEINHAISNSFGFGGHNCVIVISKYRR